LSLAVLLVQSGFHAYTAAMPLAFARAGVADAVIGLIMGVAAVVQIPAALVGGRLVDAFGGTRLFTLGGLAYLVATLVVLLPGVDVDGQLAPFVVVRILQGAGIALVLPAALALVPRLVDASGLAKGLSIVGAAQNLTLVLAPPISIAILARAGLDGVALAVVGVVIVGILLGQRLPLRPVAPAASTLAAATRRFGITYRRTWTVPLLITVSYVAHWGAVTAYLPIRAEQAGADIGLYFVADGIAIFLMRVPTGWLVDRVTSRLLILVGAGMTAVAIGMLLLPLTTPLLIASGLLGGAGGGIVLTPITVELSRRSSDADRGSAFSLLSGGLAAAMTIGSIGGAPIVAVLGLSAALVMGIVLIAVAMALAISDPSLATKGRAVPAAVG
ncbi:MAG TPA: MFS transporter, partial [Candidatus Limnocylindrales bacterium]|nr:MFS transporter [Candidatus Limnocylindrales bacterium]